MILTKEESLSTYRFETRVAVIKQRPIACRQDQELATHGWLSTADDRSL